MKGSQSRRFLNIGGGYFQNRANGWLNLDYTFEARAKKAHPENFDIIHNLMSKTPIPLENDSVDAVYTEHCIEHLPFHVAEYVFNDVYRILKRGGCFRVSVPDAQIFYDAFMDGSVTDEKMPTCLSPKRAAGASKTLRFLDAVISCLSEEIGGDELRAMFSKHGMVASLMELERRRGEVTIESQYGRPGDHNSWWTGKRLLDIMSTVGFRNVCRKAPNDSVEEEFRKDYIDATVPEMSVRVEGVK